MQYHPRFDEDIFRTKTDIPHIFSTTNQFPDKAKFMFVGIRNNKTQQIRR